MDEINESNNQPTSLAPSLIETKDQISTINHHHSSSSNTQESFIINQDKTREEQPRLKVVMEQVVDKYLETAPSNRSDNLINSMQYHQDQRNSLTNHLQTIDPTRKLMDLEPKEQQQKTHSNTIAHSDHQVTYSFKPQKKQAVKKEQPQRVPCYALSIGGVICVLRVDYFALLPISIPTPALFYYSLSKTHTFDECSGVDPSLASNIDTDLKIFTFYINTLTQFIQHPIQFNLKSKQTHILIMREEIRVYPLSIMTKKGQRVFKNHDEVVNVRQAVIDKMILKKEIVMKELNEMKMLLDGELDEWMYREKDATCGIFIS